jgi:hypothetical protein
VCMVGSDVSARSAKDLRYAFTTDKGLYAKNVTVQTSANTTNERTDARSVEDLVCVSMARTNGRVRTVVSNASIAT